FFTAVAALLTGGDGLGWNRVMIWSCAGKAPNAAELVYALGGLGDEKHRELQKEVGELRLKDLIEVRLREPIPRGTDKQGREHIDPLYELTVGVPRKEQSVRVFYGATSLSRRSRRKAAARSGRPTHCGGFWTTRPTWWTPSSPSPSTWRKTAGCNSRIGRPMKAGCS